MLYGAMQGQPRQPRDQETKRPRDQEGWRQRRSVVVDRRWRFLLRGCLARMDIESECSQPVPRCTLRCAVVFRCTVDYPSVNRSHPTLVCMAIRCFVNCLLSLLSPLSLLLLPSASSLFVSRSSSCISFPCLPAAKERSLRGSELPKERAPSVNPDQI